MAFVAIEHVDVADLEEVQAGGRDRGSNNGAGGVALLNEGEEAPTDIGALSLVSLCGCERGPRPVNLRHGIWDVDRQQGHAQSESLSWGSSLWPLPHNPRRHLLQFQSPHPGFLR